MPDGVGETRGERHSRGGHRIYVPPPHSRRDPLEDVGPPGVMWPEPGSGFDPSLFSPAGQMKQEAQFFSNIGRDPGGVWRAVRSGPGLILMFGAVLLFLLVAIISVALG